MRRADANLTMRNSLVVTLLLSLVIMALALWLAEPFMRLAGAEETMEDTLSYFRIIAAALPSTPFRCASARRSAAWQHAPHHVCERHLQPRQRPVQLAAHQRRRAPSRAWRSPARHRHGHRPPGRPRALLYLPAARQAPRPLLELTRKDSWKLDREAAGGNGEGGQGRDVEQVFIRIGFFLYARIVAGLGVYVYAAHNIAMQFLSLSFSFGDGIGIAGTALVGQSLGEKRPTSPTCTARSPSALPGGGASAGLGGHHLPRAPGGTVYLFRHRQRRLRAPSGDERHGHRRHHAAVSRHRRWSIPALCAARATRAMWPWR